MTNPNEVKFVIKLNMIERYTTLVKEPFPFETHSKSYSRWKKWIFDFSNFNLKIHHDPRFKWKSIQHESYYHWSHLYKKSNIISFGSKLRDFCMASLWEVFWQILNSNDHTHLHASTWWIQYTLHTNWKWISSFLRPKSLPMHPFKEVSNIGQISSGANIKCIAYLNKLKASDSWSTPGPCFARSIQTPTAI